MEKIAKVFEKPLKIIDTPSAKREVFMSYSMKSLSMTLVSTSVNVLKSCT